MGPSLVFRQLFEKSDNDSFWLHNKEVIHRRQVLFYNGRRNPSGQLLHKPGCSCIHYLCQTGVQNPRLEENDDGEDDKTNNDTDDYEPHGEEDDDDVDTTTDDAGEYDEDKCDHDDENGDK